MQGRVGWSLIPAASCGGALAITGLLAFDWPVARAVDAESLAGFYRLSAHPLLFDVATRIASAATLSVYLGTGAILAAIALARGRRRLACAVPLTMLASSATTEILKRLSVAPRTSSLLGPEQQILPGSWPSGHITAVMTLALCAIVVAPPAWRWLVGALSVIVVICVSYAVLILTWHFPTDVVGGLLVAGAGVWAMLAVLDWWERRTTGPRELRAGRVAAVTPAALAVLGLCAVALTQLLQDDHASLHATMVAAAIVIAALATALGGGLALTLAPPDSAPA